MAFDTLRPPHRAGLGVCSHHWRVWSTQTSATLTLKKVEPNINLPQPHQVQLRFANPLGERIQEILLPREMLAAIYEHKATWDKVILPAEGLPLKFWRAQKNGKHPQWFGHPLEHFTDRELGKVIPASVRDSQFFIWALFDKAGITEEGDAGYRTLDKFFDLLAWSFEFMFKGIHPTCNAQGEPQLGRQTILYVSTSWHKQLFFILLKSLIMNHPRCCPCFPIGSFTKLTGNLSNLGSLNIIRHLSNLGLPSTSLDISQIRVPSTSPDISQIWVPSFPQHHSTSLKFGFPQHRSTSLNIAFPQLPGHY